MKRVVITGATRGIGKATAEQFLAAGWEVVGTLTNNTGWKRQNLKWVQLDLSDNTSIAQAAEKISAYKPINILVNNAGIYAKEEDHNGATVEISTLRKILEVNLIGTIDLTERLIPALAEGCHIISLGSGAGALTTISSDDVPAYRISKAALGMYTRTLALRLQGKSITVSIIDPGWVKTDMGGAEAPRSPEEPAKDIFELAISKVPTGKFWKQGKERSW
ncbi:SDR family NAD(P)-dependent oxidoreductase [Patescibacteria group bacterium]|nr:SDR family NAD(P)-dependent oxidoreductase [Patescibacteria group bacterium]